MSNLLDRITEQLGQLEREKWPELAIVLPSRRSAVFLRKKIVEQTPGCAVLPLILPIEDFFTRILGKKKATQEEALYLMYEAYCQTHSSPEPFASFLKWGELLLQDLDEADRNSVDNDSLFRFLKDIRLLEKWGIDDPESRNPTVDRYLSFWEDLVDTQAAFHTLCRERNAYTKGLIYRDVNEGFPAFWIAFKRREGISKLLFAGLNALNQVEERVIANLVKEAEAEVLWEAPPFLLDPMQESGRFLRSYKKWSPEESFIHSHLDTAQQWEVVESSVALNMVKSASQVLKRLVEEKGETVLERTAWVLADESLLVPILNSLPPKLKGANVTLG
jgi:hypothetical protein